MAPRIQSRSQSDQGLIKARWPFFPHSLPTLSPLPCDAHPFRGGNLSLQAVTNLFGGIFKQNDRAFVSLMPTDDDR